MKLKKQYSNKVYKVSYTTNYYSEMFLFLDKKEAEFYVIEIYYHNFNHNYYSIDKNNKFSIEKILILDKINEFVDNKHFSEASDLILKTFNSMPNLISLTTKPVTNVTEPTSIHKQEVNRLIKESIFT